MIAQKWKGKISDASETNTYVVMPISHQLIEIASIESQASFNAKDIIEYKLSPFLSNMAISVFGVIPPMIVEPKNTEYFIATTEPFAEWIVEQMGYRETLRLKIGWNASVIDELIEEMDDDTIIIPYLRHYAVKLRSAESKILLEIKFAEYKSTSFTTSSIEELATKP